MTEAGEAVACVSGNVATSDKANCNGSGVDESGASFTLTARDRHAVAYGFKYHVSACAGTTGFGEELAPTQIAGNPPAVVTRCGGEVVCLTGTQEHGSADEGLCGTLTARMFKDPPLVAVSDD